MKTKTSELVGPALDWAVAKCEAGMLYLYYADGEPLYLEEAPDYHQKWNPSENWVQGGPIIEREKIDLSWQSAGQAGWMAYGHDSTDCGIPLYDGNGPTPLIAAMRCYVASKLGDEVEVPDELA